MELKINEILSKETFEMFTAKEKALEEKLLTIIDN